LEVMMTELIDLNEQKLVPGHQKSLAITLLIRVEAKSFLDEQIVKQAEFWRRSLEGIRSRARATTTMMNISPDPMDKKLGSGTAKGKSHKKKGQVTYSDANYGMSMNFNKDEYAAVESSDEEVEESDDSDFEMQQLEVKGKPKVKAKANPDRGEVPHCPRDCRDGRVFFVEEDEHNFYFWRMDTMGRIRRRQFAKAKNNALPSLALAALRNDGTTNDILEQLGLSGDIEPLKTRHLGPSTSSKAKKEKLDDDGNVIKPKLGRPPGAAKLGRPSSVNANSGKKDEVNGSISMKRSRLIDEVPEEDDDNDMVDYQCIDFDEENIIRIKIFSKKTKRQRTKIGYK